MSRELAEGFSKVCWKVRRKSTELSEKDRSLLKKLIGTHQDRREVQPVSWTLSGSGTARPKRWHRLGLESPSSGTVGLGDGTAPYIDSVSVRLVVFDRSNVLSMKSQQAFGDLLADFRWTLGDLPIDSRKALELSTIFSTNSDELLGELVKIEIKCRVKLGFDQPIAHNYSTQHGLRSAVPVRQTQLTSPLSPTALVIAPNRTAALFLSAAATQAASGDATIALGSGQIAQPRTPSTPPVALHRDTVIAETHRRGPCCLRRSHQPRPRARVPPSRSTRCVKKTLDKSLAKVVRIERGRVPWENLIRARLEERPNGFDYTMPGLDEGVQISSSLMIIHMVGATKTLLKSLHKSPRSTHYVFKKGLTLFTIHTPQSRAVCVLVLKL
ncbi:hypothetical protein MUK42_23756 [Musa troglodytarum]|uniref:Uncharacterized protein n=1 Tax=Musa troglodytarum TaxID=320322 RepID=A0A9E7L2C8_9LILI|nr:hypothetical protein MUK42_23756 [Musa troglodytarum]